MKKHLLVVGIVSLFVTIGICPNIAGFNEDISQINVNTVEDFSFDIIYINDIYTELCDGCGITSIYSYCLIANTGTTTITEEDLKNIEINVNSNIEGATFDVYSFPSQMEDRQIEPGQVAGHIWDGSNDLLADFLKSGETLINWEPDQILFMMLNRDDYIGNATFNITFSIRGKIEYLQTNVDFQDGRHYINLISGERTNCNFPPYAPTINGPIKGKPNVQYTFTFNSSDPEGRDVRYHIDWGDTTIEVTDWYPSCNPIIINHTYNSSGNYVITAYAEDEEGNVSPENSYLFVVPRHKAVTSNMFLLKLLERFPLLWRVVSRLNVR